MKKFTKIMSAAVLAAASLSLSGCQDEDFGYTAEEIAFVKNFKQIYGEVDQTQDWNLAERAGVTVSVSESSQIKIYALERGEYQLVGDYSAVTGTRTLYVDVVEGTTDLIVTDGSYGTFCKVGESVNLGTGTRTAYPAAGNGDQEARVTVADNYRQFPIEYITTVTSNTSGAKGTLPEEEYNLDKVSQNFNFISTGPFTFYPMYWNTTSKHRLGIYWKDAGGHIHTQDIYASKEGDELATCAWSSGTECTDGFPIHIGDKCGGYTTHTISKIEGGKKYYSGLVQCRDAYQWKVGDVCNHGHKITRVEGNNKYYMSDESTCSNYNGGTCYHEGYEYVSDGVHRRKDGVKEEQQCYDNDHTWAVDDVCVAGHQITALNNGSYDGQFYNGYIECTDAMPAHHIGDQCSAGHTIDYIDGSKYYYGSTFAFTPCDLEHRAAQTSSDATDKYIGSKPITVNLPVGTVFGLYLEVYTYGDAYYHTVYSESEVNQRCAKTDLKGNAQGQNSGITDGKNMKGTYVFGATFQKEIDGTTRKFFCFEDWNKSGPDLNDLVFMFDSENVPVTMDQDGDHWIISAEDLGNTLDIDYNDVVLDISHVSGRTTATFLPLAAGGNLASFLYFNNGVSDECLGEIHSLFGEDTKTSGSYTPINVSATTPEVYSSLQKTVTVSDSWSLASYAVGSISEELSTNMGGFYMKVVPHGQASTEINAVGQQKIAPTSGATHGSDNVPYVICTPRDWSYNIDADTKKSGKYRWPMENVPMVPTEGFPKGPAYNTSDHSFASWVANKSTATDWYMYPDLSCTTADQLPTNMTISVQTSTGSIIGDYVPVQSPNITADASVTVAVGNSIYPQIKSSSPATISITSEDTSIATVTYTSGTTYFTLNGVKSGTTRIVIHQDAYINPSDENEQYSDVTFYISVTVSGPLSVTLPTAESVGRGQMNVVDLVTNDPNATVSVTSADESKVNATYVPSTKQIQITGMAVTDSPVNLTVRVTPSNAELYTLTEGTYIEKTIAITVTMPQHQLTLSSSTSVELSALGATSQIIASSTSGKVIYTSSNTSIASVSEEGLITAIGNGSATITVKAVDRDDATEQLVENSATVEVSVSAYGTKVDAQYVGNGKNIPASYFTSASTKITITAKANGDLRFRLIGNNAFPMGYDYNQVTNTQKSYTITGEVNISHVKTNGLTFDCFDDWTNGGGGTLTFYILCE